MSKDDGTPAHAIGPYGEIYGREKAKAMLRVAATEHLPYKIDDRQNPEKWTKDRANNHARRLMTKAALRDLWLVWHGKTPRGSRAAGPEDMPNMPRSA